MLVLLSAPALSKVLTYPVSRRSAL